MRFDITRASGGFFLIGISIALSWLTRNAFGFSIDFPFATLLAFALAASFSEAFVLTGITGWIINWSYFFEPETAIFLMLPIIIVLARKKFFPWKNIYSAFVISALGVMVFYGIVGFSSAFATPFLFMSIVIGSGVWGAISYVFFVKGYGA